MRLLHAELASLYDAFETPRAVRGEIEALDPPAARAYLREVRERTSPLLDDRDAPARTICEMVLRHELQHCETMRQTLAIADLLPAGEPPLEPSACAARLDATARRSFTMGAAEDAVTILPTTTSAPQHEVRWPRSRSHAFP